MFHVLSIDWDYFIHADGEERLAHFPDIPSEKYPKELQNIIWKSRYSSDDDLLKIGYDPFVHEIVEKLFYVPRVIVADSHKWIVPYSLQAKAKQFHILNIDFHSDFRDDTESLDCGNWLSILMGQYGGKYEWLGWKDSYKRGIPKRLRYFTDRAEAVRLIDSTVWDMLFICRSDMWSPPHLDNDFTRVFQPLVQDSVVTGEIQQGIWESRYDEKFRSDVDKMRNTMEKFYKKQE